MLWLVASAAPAAAAGIETPRDGWVRWQVPTVADAPAWCCFGDRRTDRHDDAGAQVCRLDGVDSGYGSRGGETIAELRIYARFAGGKLDKLRALAETCPANAATPIRNLQNISAEASVRWLATALEAQNGSRRSPEQRLGSDILAALAMHQGEAARRALTGIAYRDASVDKRKEALFWATQARGAEGVEIVAPRLFDDADAAVREHAAFALAQTPARARSSAKPIAPLLIRAGEADRDAGVRAKAWFWLSQSKAAESEAAIGRALKQETDAHVREQAVFALSQLPEERAVGALVAVAEDKSLSREERKRAIFWLGQMKSDRAVQYLDRLLAAR